LFFGEIQGLTQLDGYLLLLKEYKFVILHVFFRVSFQVCPQFVQVQAVPVVALLIVQEELAEFGSAK